MTRREIVNNSLKCYRDSLLDRLSRMKPKTAAYIEVDQLIDEVNQMLRELDE